ncbi:hypothetical protein TNIN_249101 [Trichonephila inaurata madagascariensis]|uniref:Uncharacterized protein n=1 Tax=Trichonephila inaurata madagascariensis TaxID=2747483 RepID=A0A8X7CLW3_9ARAC|nr:hypothetical protein TNIN_249101 [Trichonephila inaurata madagascariensis]
MNILSPRKPSGKSHTIKNQKQKRFQKFTLPNSDSDLCLIRSKIIRRNIFSEKKNTLRRGCQTLTDEQLLTHRANNERIEPFHSLPLNTCRPPLSVCPSVHFSHASLP